MELIKTLNQDEIERMQSATADLLENIGIKVQHDKILSIAKKGGADVDETNGIVRLPKPMLNELLSSVPSQYPIRGLDGRTWHVGNGCKQVWHGIVTDPWIVDYETQQPRRPRLEDIRKHSAIAQQLDKLCMVSRMDFPVSDYDDETSSNRALEEHLSYFSKHCAIYATSMESINQWLEIGELFMNGSPLKNSHLFSIAVGSLSPLGFAGINGDLLLTACEYGFPVIPTVCPMAGTTSPYSLASTLLIGNAEIIFIAAMSQLVNPGNPFLYTYGPSVTDMRSGHDLYYTLDKVLWKIAGAQLGKAYKMPTSAECGGSLTYRYDVQNGAEGMLFMLAATKTADMLCGIGSTHNANGMSAEMMLIHTAWYSASQHLIKGMQIDDLRLAMENIRSAGPGNHYLTDDLTMEFLRGGEFFSNNLFDVSGGFEPSKSLLEKAHEQVRAMTSNISSPHSDKTLADLHQLFETFYTKR